MPTSTVENYLKAIYALADDLEADALVPIGKIAESLELTSGTVTTMMKHLANEGFIDYQLRRGVRLTRTGQQAALQVMRRHRLIELFLVEIMGLDWAHVHEEAEVLEHVLSDRLVHRIDEMLGHPVADPHGDPIPDAKGQMHDNQSQPLSHCPPGHYQMVRVARDEPTFLNWLRESGLKPGVRLEIMQRDAFAGVIQIHANDSKHQMSDAVAESLWVKPAPAIS